MMPIGEGRNYEKVGEESMLELLQARYGNARPFAGEMGNGPGHYYDFPGFSGKVGFISAVTHKFCNSCNRLRLTSRGFLKTCLQYEQGVDLGVRLRIRRKRGGDLQGGGGGGSAETGGASVFLRRGREAGASHNGSDRRMRRLKFYDRAAEESSGEARMVLTVLEGESLGEKCLLEGGKILWMSHRDGFFSRHREELCPPFSFGKEKIGGIQVFCDCILQADKIILCGAGHVSLAVIRMAKLLGFSCDGAGRQAFLCRPGQGSRSRSGDLCSFCGIAGADAGGRGRIFCGCNPGTSI